MLAAIPYRRSIALFPLATRKAGGSWLVARLLADLASMLPTAAEGTLPGELVEIYDSVLRQAGATDPKRWQNVILKGGRMNYARF